MWLCRDLSPVPGFISTKLMKMFAAKKTPQVVPFLLMWVVCLSWSNVNCSTVCSTKTLLCIGIWADTPTLRHKPAVIAPTPDLAGNRPYIQCCYGERTSRPLPRFTSQYVSQHVSIWREHSLPSVWLSRMCALDCCRFVSAMFYKEELQIQSSVQNRFTLKK